MSWSNLAKNVISYTGQALAGVATYLLQETGDYLLLEDGGKIVLTSAEGLAYTNKTKNVFSSTNQNKNTLEYANQDINTLSYTNQGKN